MFWRSFILESCLILIIIKFYRLFYTTASLIAMIMVSFYPSDALKYVIKDNY